MKGLVRHPAAYFIDYSDGTHATLLMLDGALGDYNFAARVRGMSEPLSCQFLLPPVPNVAYSECLMHQVETMIESGRAPSPSSDASWSAVSSKAASIPSSSPIASCSCGYSHMRGLGHHQPPATHAFAGVEDEGTAELTQQGLRPMIKFDSIAG